MRSLGSIGLTSLIIGARGSASSPLKGMPLTYLNLHDGPKVQDLTLLTGMPLTGERQTRVSEPTSFLTDLLSVSKIAAGGRHTDTGTWNTK